MEKLWRGDGANMEKELGVLITTGPNDQPYDEIWIVQLIAICVNYLAVFG
jgi:hypothetical protein